MKVALEMTRLPKPKLTNRQLVLFETREIQKAGALRWFVGEVIEELTTEVFGGMCLRTDGCCSYCPDVQFEWGFAECKSSGRGGRIIVYEFRAEKDRRFVEAGNRLDYIVWRHRLKLEVPVLESTFRTAMRAGVYECVRVSHQTLYNILCEQPIRTVNSGTTRSGYRLGYGTREYGEGWCLPVNRLKELCEQQPNLTVDGRDVEYYQEAALAEADAAADNRHAEVRSVYRRRRKQQSLFQR